MMHRFGRGSLVLHKGRPGIVVSKHGHICPWYRVEFHQPMPTPTGKIEPEWLDRSCHKKKPEWHYQVSLQPVPSGWDGLVPVSFLRRALGFQVVDVWFRGFCSGRSEGWKDRKRKA